MGHHSDTEMKSYYKDRAPIYDRVYSYPERQANLRTLEKYIPELFIGKSVIEVAAGTGYWTQFIAAEAESILATDATVEALEQIGNRTLNTMVSTKVVDAYSINEVAGRYNGAFAGLWFSHIPKQRLNEFLSSLHQLLSAGATVVFIDNSLAQCARLPLSHTDDIGNTYQDRKMDNGSVHRVLKNFPTEKELLEATIHFGTNHKYMELENFWLFQYTAS